MWSGALSGSVALVSGEVVGRGPSAGWVAERGDPGSIEIGRLDMQQVVDAPVTELPLEDVEGGQLTRLLHPQAAGQQQLQQCPVPERGNLGSLGAPVIGPVGDGLLG